MKLKMKKFFAALGALAIVGMVAVGCEGKQPKVEDSITVKQSGKDVTALTMSVGDKVAITTNAASAADGALVVVAKPAGFTVTSSDQNVVAASNTALEAKAAGNAKVTFTAGKAKHQISVQVKEGKGGEDIKDENYYGMKLENEKLVSAPTIYIPTSLKFSEMKDWKNIVTKAMTAKGWKVNDPDLGSGYSAYGFKDPSETRTLFFSSIWYFYEGKTEDGKPWEPRVMSNSIYGVADKQDADAYVKKLKPVADFSALMGKNWRAVGEQKESGWQNKNMNFGNGVKTYEQKIIEQYFVDENRGIVMVLFYTILKDMANASAQYAGCPASAFDFVFIESPKSQSTSALRSTEKISSYMLKSMPREARLLRK